MIGIYKITNKKNGKVYVGQSKDVEKRWVLHRSYLRGNKHPNYILQNSWNKHSEENFEFEVLEECLYEDLVIRENYWCNEYKAYIRPFGYNIVITTDGTKHTITEDARRRAGDARRGKAHTEEVKQRLSQAHKGKKLSEETKQKMKESFTNGKRKPMTTEQRERISMLVREKAFTPESNKKRAEAKRKPVFCYNLLTKQKESYSSIRAAKKVHSKTGCSMIIKSCKIKGRLADECVWSYKEEDLMEKLQFVSKRSLKRIDNRLNKKEKLPLLPKKVHCLFIKSGLTEIYSNVDEAANALGVSKRKIIRNLCREIKKAEWKYVFTYITN